MQNNVKMRRSWIPRLFALSCLIFELGCSKRASPSKTSKQFLERYNGETIQQLLTLTNDYGIDSIILAIEEALERKSDADLSRQERVVLAVEALEREVNNGGYEQFFANSPEFAPAIAHCLHAIGCTKTSEITADAIAVLNLPREFDAAAAKHAVSNLGSDSKRQLAECDSRYFANDESIEQTLFAYILQHQHAIRIP